MEGINYTKQRRPARLAGSILITADTGKDQEGSTKTDCKISENDDHGSSSDDDDNNEN